MLENKFKRGFTLEKLKPSSEPRVKHDSGGYYINTLSENAKVYFDDYYDFLKKTYEKSQRELSDLEEKVQITNDCKSEVLSYYRAKKIILDLVLKTVREFYINGSSYGIIMTPWCFGTVLLEKVEVYREQLAKGEIEINSIPEYPFYIIKYMDEIYKKTLLDLFDFPPEAFKMRWQYSELLKRYGRVLSDVSKSLNSVLMTIKNYGA